MQTMYVTCNVCNGSGKNPLDLTDRMVCWKCHGEGMMYVMTNAMPGESTEDQPEYNPATNWIVKPAEDVKAEVEAAAEAKPQSMSEASFFRALCDILGRNANATDEDMIVHRVKALQDANSEVARLVSEQQTEIERQAARIKELEAEQMKLLGSIILMEGERDDAKKALDFVLIRGATKDGTGSVIGTRTLYPNQLRELNEMLGLESKSKSPYSK